MNSSNGFGTGSLLGSSTGFKKRPLLRPPSGMLSKKQQYLKSVDISQAESAIGASIRAEVAVMEEEINLLDKDRRLRQGQSGLQKNWVVSLRKWLRDIQGSNQKEDDEVKILKQLGAESIEAGFKKLWRIACHLDLAISKISQLQIVHLLIYDEMFDSLASDTQKSLNILGQIGNQGYSPATFQITEVLLERSKDLFAATKRSGPQKRQDTSEIIGELKRQNAKLTALLEQLGQQRQSEKKREKEKQKQREKQKENVINSSTSISSNSNRDIVKELQDKFDEQIKSVTNERNRCQQNLIELKVQLSSLQAQAKANDSVKEIPKVAASGSYEQALIEEMEKMKKGFEKKIAVLNQQFSGKERQLRKREAQLKGENQKVKWEKSLLLKKYELINK